MKKRRKIIILLVTILLINENAFAHPGRTDGNGCHTCRTNCESWGLRKNEYHCHNGNSYSNSSGSNNSDSSSNSNSSNNSGGSNSSSSSTNQGSSTSSNEIYVKSNDTSIASITIDNIDINIDEEMNFSTTNQNPTILVTPSHNKASVEVEKNPTLKSGNNKIIITITAEDSTKKQYILNIKLISMDATLKNLRINKKNITIQDEIKMETTDEKISIEAIPTNKNAKVTYDKDKKLKIGNNEFIIQVTAEDGITNKQYILNIERKRVLSNNTNVKISINGKEVKFNHNKSNIIYLSHNTDKIEIDYELEDEKSKIDLEYDKNLQVGSREIKFKIISESNKTEEYIINLYRYDKYEEVISTIIGIIMIFVLGFGTYKLFKLLKKIRRIKL